MILLYFILIRYYRYGERGKDKNFTKNCELIHLLNNPFNRSRIEKGENSAEFSPFSITKYVPSSPKHILK